MDIAALLFLIGFCDGLGHVFLALAWVAAWPFRQTARGCFALADKLTFGRSRP